MRLTIALIACFVGGIALTLIAIVILDPKTSLRPKHFGEFVSSPKVELQADGRMLRLLENFIYIDPDKKAWVATKDLVVDGASIPRVFWTLTGGPLEGQFRNASIVHDEACNRMTEPWEDVHLMFYNACRCGGVSEYKAKVLYAAVYHFGPRWTSRPVAETRVFTDPDGTQHTVTVQRTVSELVRPEEPDASVRRKLEEFVSDQNPNLDELQAINPRAL
jgi:hypothetical protein